MDSTALRDARNRALSDLWFFNRYVIGWPDIDNRFHRGLCRVAQAWNAEQFTLFLEPRGHLKSSCLTIGSSAWEICRNPNIRIALFNGQYATGMRLMRDTRRQFSHNPRMRGLFPQFCIPAGKVKLAGTIWSDLAFEVPGRTIIVEPTMTLVSVGGSAVSQHFDLLNFDDMLDREHVTTKELRDKHESWFYDTFALRHDPGHSRITLRGTFWHHDDTYSRIIKKEKESRKAGEPKRWLVHRSSVWEAPSKPSWPERFTPSVIAQLRADSRNTYGSDYTFNCQYLLNPTPTEHAVLKWTHVRQIEDADIQQPYANYASVYYRIDKDEGRYDAIVLVAVDFEGNICARKVWTGSWTPAQLLSDLAYLSKAYSLDGVFVEDTLMEHTLIPAMTAVDEHRYGTIPFRGVARPDTQRTGRILALEPVIAKGQFYLSNAFARSVDLHEEFDQMSSAGSLGHDVLLTCFADFAGFAGRPHRPEPKYPIPGSMGEAFPWPPSADSAQRAWRWNPLDEVVGLR